MSFSQDFELFAGFGRKRTFLALFFIENNFWNNISARDASPGFVVKEFAAIFSV